MGGGSQEWGGGDGGVSPFDTQRAFRTFEDLFGSVHSRWRPGMTVSGTVKSAGKRAKITIFPDGTVEEEESADTTGGRYSSIYTSDGHSTVMHIEGDPRELIFDFVRSRTGVFGTLLIPILTVLLHPLMCCGCCGYWCCLRQPQPPKTRRD